MHPRPDLVHPSSQEGYDHFDFSVCSPRRPSIRKCLTWLALGVAVSLLLLWPVAAHSQERLRAMFCNTAEQLRELMEAKDDKTSLETVNARDGPTSCGGMDVIAYRDEPVGDVQRGKKLYRIYRISIIAQILNGLLMPGEDEQYAAFFIREDEGA